MPDCSLDCHPLAGDDCQRPAQPRGDDAESRPYAIASDPSSGCTFMNDTSVGR
jgi:hypothetical protein